MTYFFIQARMTSKRLPGKVLKKLQGKPLLQHLTDRLVEKFDFKNIVILTSDEPSDIPIVDFAEKSGLKSFRGSLENVYGRFTKAIDRFGPENFVRICGDSPLLDVELVEKSINLYLKNNIELVTNVFPRTFPKGQSVEVIKSEVFVSSDYCKTSNFSNEHITSGFYSKEKNYKILNIYNQETNFNTDFAVDTFEDFSKIDKYLKNNNNCYPSFNIIGAGKNYDANQQ